MLAIILYIILVSFIILAFVLWYEIKHAPTIDDKEPFLWDDFVIRE